MGAHRPAPPPVVPTSGRWVVEEARDDGIDDMGGGRRLAVWQLVLRHADGDHREVVETYALPTTTYRVGQEVEGEVRPGRFGTPRFYRAPPRVRERRA